MMAPVNWDDYDQIDLRGVRVHGKHGVLPDEKIDGHDFFVDALLWLDTAAAGTADALEYSVSYADIAQIIERVVDAPSVDLIETLAERICDAILAEHPLIRRVRVSINKPSAPIPQPFANVTVSAVRNAPPQVCVLALGSNMGDPRAHLVEALEGIRTFPGTRVRAVSRVYETDPVGGVDQASFLNAAVLVETQLSPWHVHRCTSELERQGHRVRDVRWGPRTLDVDVITWGSLILDDPNLTLPHPRAHERGFVLAPMLDVSAETGLDIRLPGHDSVHELASLVGTDGVRPGPALPGFGDAE